MGSDSIDRGYPSKTENRTFLDQSSLTPLILAFSLLTEIAFAHHSAVGLYDEESFIEIEGEIVDVLWRNPHVSFTVLQTGVDGEETTWEIEGASINRLNRRGLGAEMVRIGDHVQIAGNPSRQGRNTMEVTNMLLPDGTELLLLNPSLPQRWSDNLKGTGFIEIDEDKAAAARESARGIFRVWNLAFEGDSDIGALWNDSYPLTDAARAAQERWNPATDNPLARCVPPGMPTTMSGPYPSEFVEQGFDILLRIEEFDNVRTIHLDDDASAGGQLASSLGYSTGHWEGSTLVVNTTNISWPWFDRRGVPQSEAVEIVERFTLSEDQSRLDYRATITDPATFAEPVVLDTWRVWAPGEVIAPYNCVISNVVINNE
jgi:hypothetical protein